MKLFMRYVMARFKEYQRELAYRVYISDSLFYYGQQKQLTKRWSDIAYPKPVDKRSGDEIALEVIKKAGLRFGES